MPIRRARFNKVKRKEGIEANPQMPAYITSCKKFGHTMVWHNNTYVGSFTQEFN